jgi:signal peptidase I
MAPTYQDGDINFCWRLRYLLSAPERHDVVAIHLAGNKVVLLKRVVALEGEHVEFRHGKLMIDGIEIEEPYLSRPCDWNLEGRRVKKGCVYVVGDNRAMPMANHYFGQTSVGRIIGGPLW